MTSSVSVKLLGHGPAPLVLMPAAHAHVRTANTSGRRLGQRWQHSYSNSDICMALLIHTKQPKHKLQYSQTSNKSTLRLLIKRRYSLSLVGDVTVEFSAMVTQLDDGHTGIEYASNYTTVRQEEASQTPQHTHTACLERVACIVSPIRHEAKRPVFLHKHTVRYLGTPLSATCAVVCTLNINENPRQIITDRLT